jgi:hypothetical protein
MFKGTIFINLIFTPFLVSVRLHLYHWECNKVNEGSDLDLKLYWETGNPVLGLGQGVELF